MEIMLEDEEKPGLKPPRTMTVVVFLAAFAVVMSWLSCYAVTNALVAADVLKPFNRDADPRPRWMVMAFIIIFISSGLIGLLLGWISKRQLRKIDSTADA
ncbi:MAG TPA: hypothetical protein VGQ99_06005 [Tepidisphaeraceae bacterium]|nr:hypothetical protein [Tepidisphaeraceae bacterium]